MIPAAVGIYLFSGFFFCIFYIAAVSWRLVAAASCWTPIQELTVGRQHPGIQTMDLMTGGGEVGLRGATGGVSAA